MKKKLLLCATFLVLLFCATVGADTDTQDDPLVTKSYVANSGAEQVQNAVAQQIENTLGKNDSLNVSQMEKGI